MHLAGFTIERLFLSLHRTAKIYINSNLCKSSIAEVGKLLYRAR